jgi:hypothetical protein
MSDEPTAKKRGRPKLVRPVQNYELIDPATIAPLRDGIPDLYNYVPSRFVSEDEANFRGWPLFYDGRKCRYQHQAARYASNPNQCTDCHRLKRGKEPVYGKTGGEPEYKQRPYKQRAPDPVGTLPAVKPLEPNASEKEFLVAYAETKDFLAACDRAKFKQAQIHMRLSVSKVFKDACNDLETRLGIKQTIPFAGEFDWDEDKRTRLLTVYIDTGDIAAARDSIGCTATQFYKELEANGDFQLKLDAAKPLADNALEERAVQFALAGNDKLLAKILSAKKPEYRERMQMDLNLTEKLTDDQLNKRLAQLVASAKRRGDTTVIDAIFSEPPREIGTVGNPGGTRETTEPEQNCDLL